MQAVVGVEKVLRQHLHRARYGHEVRVTFPPRDHVPMKMTGNPRAGGVADVHTEIHSLGSKLATYDVGREPQLVGECGVMRSSQPLESSDVAPWRDHEMAAVVRITIQHHHRGSRRGEHEVSSIVARARKLAEETSPPLRRRDQGHTPRRPQHLHRRQSRRVGCARDPGSPQGAGRVQPHETGLTPLGTPRPHRPSCRRRRSPARAGRRRAASAPCRP